MKKTIPDKHEEDIEKNAHKYKLELIKSKAEKEGLLLHTLSSLLFAMKPIFKIFIDFF